MSDEIADRLEAWGRRETFDALELGVIDPPPRLIAAVARARRRRMALRVAAAVSALGLAAYAGWEAMRSGVVPAPEPAFQTARPQPINAQTKPPETLFEEATDKGSVAISRQGTIWCRAPEPLILPWPMAKPATPLPSMPPVTTKREPPP